MRIWLYIWVTRRVFCKKQELITLHEHMSSPPVFLVVSVLLIFLVFCVVLLCVVTFWVPCCDVRYDFLMKTLFCSSLPPVVCKRVHVLLTLFACALWCPTHIVLWFFALFFFVLCTLFLRFLRIIHILLSFRYSLTFITDTVTQI